MKNLYQALLKAQQEFGPILKDNTATVATKSGSYNYQYADLGTVIETIEEPLRNHGLVYFQTMRLDDQGRSITTKTTDPKTGEVKESATPVSCLVTTLAHADSGESIESSVALVCSDPNDPQKVGSSITYFRRYQLLALLGISPEDDDGGAASASAPRIERPERPYGQSTLARRQTSSVQQTRTFDDNSEYPCEVAGCQNTQEGSWARTCYTLGSANSGGVS